MSNIFSRAKVKFSRKAISLQRLETFRKEVTTDCHIIPLEELCLRLKTDPVTGLTHEHAKETLKKTGRNALTPSKKTPEFIKLLKQLFYGFSMLLWIGAGLCTVSVFIKYSATKEFDWDSVILGLVLIIVVLVTGIFMYIEDRKSSKIMSSFAKMAPPRATVIRNGQITQILSEEVVVGDLVEIKFGDRIPADCRIIENHGLKVDNSALTGETEAQTRSINSSSENYLETKNIVYYSTSAVEGVGRGIVVACGDHTAMGHIAGLTARLKPNESPLSKELHRFMVIVSCWACFLGLLCGIASITTNHSLIETLLFVIGIIVANVPEGLMATVTVSLRVTAKKMASKNCMVKTIDAVETLGSTSVICSDKTGTLTLNRMTVCHLWYGGKTYKADSLSAAERVGLDALIKCATLCNRAEFLPGQEKVPLHLKNVRGDASETALLKFVEKIGATVYRKEYPKIFEIPFSSSTKYQLSIHYKNKCFLMMKGAPETILERSSTILFNKETIDMNPYRQMCDKACMEFAKNGERVLGFCDLELPNNYGKDYNYQGDPINFPIRSLRFLGLISLVDPPRAQVPDAVLKCSQAGIRVIMVTGDHPVTAKAIAAKVGILSTSTQVLEIAESKQVDLFSPYDAVVIHGAVLKQIVGDDLDDIIYTFKEIVFARTTPHQKLQIVESCQRLGEVVAVTGDGVNDAPAMKKADIGIAMGITGTEVSKEAADMILLDDNFASIITGIEEGRKIFDNLKKSITYTLASNIPELLPFICYVLFNIPLPLGLIAILCIDLLTDMAPAISLAYEKAEADIMERPPRNPLRDKLVNRKLYFLAYGQIGLIEALNAFFIYFMVMAEHGFFPTILFGIRQKWEDPTVILRDTYGQLWTFEERQKLEQTCYTAVLVSVVISQVADLMACKTRYNSIFTQGMKNNVANSSLVFELLILGTLSYAPYMHYLQFYPVSFRVWVFSIPMAVVLWTYDEIRKWHIRKYPRGWFQRETYY